MRPYYILRLFPPIGLLRKYHFDNHESLMLTLANLYDTLNIENLDIKESQKKEWHRDPLGHFSECILVTHVDPSICVKHEKYFADVEKKQRIKVEYIIPYHEATA